MLITRHFDLVEFDLPADKAARHGLSGAPYPQEWIEARLVPLCRALEALRAACSGRRITILSGYRTPTYNAAVGGVPKSQHLEGRAADIRVAGLAPPQVYDAALRLYGLGRIEIGGLGLYPGWVHLDVRPGPLARWERR